MTWREERPPNDNKVTGTVHYTDSGFSSLSLIRYKDLTPTIYNKEESIGQIILSYTTTITRFSDDIHVYEFKLY